MYCLAHEEVSEVVEWPDGIRAKTVERVAATHVRKHGIGKGSKGVSGTARLGLEEAWAVVVPRAGNKERDVCRLAVYEMPPALSYDSWALHPAASSLALCCCLPSMSAAGCAMRKIR